MNAASFLASQIQTMRYFTKYDRTMMMSAKRIPSIYGDKLIQIILDGKI
jgi:hypothetical protein